MFVYSDESYCVLKIWVKLEKKIDVVWKGKNVAKRICDVYEHDAVSVLCMVEAYSIWKF